MAIAETEKEAAVGCCHILAEARLAQQRLVDGKVFPFVLSPSSPLQSAQEACKAFESSRAFLEQKLKEHGAVFLRGFRFQSGEDFQSLVDTLSWIPVPYFGSAPRTHVTGSIYTTNDSNPDVFIDFHHEMTLSQEEFQCKCGVAFRRQDETGDWTLPSNKKFWPRGCECMV